MTVDAQTPREEKPGVRVVRVAGGTLWMDREGEAIAGGSSEYKGTEAGLRTRFQNSKESLFG